MISSNYQIYFVDGATGVEQLLLDFGEFGEKQPDFPLTLDAARWTPAGGTWSRGKSRGGVTRVVEWSRLEEHASHAAAHQHCLVHGTLLSLRREGKLRVFCQGTTAWEILDATLQTVGARLVPWEGDFATLTTYRVTGGELVPLAGLLWFTGIPHAWHPTPHALNPEVHSA